MSQEYQISTPTSSQTTQYTPLYTFSELQDIWSFQKQILNKYKSTQVPFAILDQDNTGILNAKDFPYRLISRGFPFNVPFYMKFFSFIDTDQDGVINLDDWLNGFKNIGARLVEARSYARDLLNTVKTMNHSRHSSSDACSSSSTKNAQKSFDFSTERPWATPKNLETNKSTVFGTGEMKRIDFEANGSVGAHIRGRSHGEIPSGNLLGHKRERELNINTKEESQYDFAMRMNMRVDDILKGIETRKSLATKNCPKIDTPKTFARDLTETREARSFLQARVPENKQASKADEIHQSIKKASDDTVGMIKEKISPDLLQQNQLVNLVEERDTYAPSVTSIAATEEDNFTQKSEKVPEPSFRSTERKDDPLLDFESSLQAKALKAQVPTLEVGGVTGTRDFYYASERSGKGNVETKESAKSAYTNGSANLKKELSSQESKRSSQSQSSVYDTGRNKKTIVIPQGSNVESEKNITTPSWKEAPKGFPGKNAETAADEDALEMIEDILAEFGGCGEVMSSYKKGDIERFPHLQMLVKELYEKENKKEAENVEVRGRGLVESRGIKKRSRTKSMVELRVRGDLLVEMESYRQRKRAVTPENSVCSTSRRMAESPNRIANAEKMIESLREFGRQKIRTRDRSVELGKELAKEILETSGRKSCKEEKGENRISGRVQEKVREVRRYGDVKRACSDIMKTLNGEKQRTGEMIRNAGNVGYVIDEKDIGRKEALVRERGLKVREENQQDREKRSQIRKMIDQLSYETATMEWSISNSRGDIKKRSFLSTTESVGQLGKAVKSSSNLQIKVEEKPEKRRTKSFLRGSLSTISKENNSSGLSIEQYSLQEQLQEKLGSTRMLNRYSKLASDLGTFSVQINKPDKSIAVSPLSGSRSSKNYSISVSSLLHEESTGRGKSFLSNQATRLDLMNKELTPCNRSLRRSGLSKH